MELYLRLILYVIFGVTPSIIWLLYYLAKDLHPEPKRMILEIFFLGSLVTIPVFFIQVALVKVTGQLPIVFDFFNQHPIAVEAVKWFIAIAAVEEIFKYLVVRTVILKSKELDEPVDIMIYMVVGALGFAAVENVLYLLSPVDAVSFQGILETTLTISFMRFLGATFLHTLCSALLGYFIALSCSMGKYRFLLAFCGIGLAVVLHGLYNFSIITLSNPFNLEMATVLLICLAVFVTIAFKNAKKMKSVCKL
jgi:RsiW-degrading membrane proteinase PrsW (M82 family)